MAIILIILLAITGSPQTSSGGTVRARILDWASGLPVVDATVSLSRDEQSLLIRRSDDSGKVTFENLRAGRHRLRVAAKGYVIKDGTQSVAGSDYRILDIAPTSDIELRVEMVPSGTITGTVRDPADNPVPGARVAAMQKQFNVFGDAVLSGANSSAQTNSRGEYVLSGLASGEYFIRVEGQPPVYYPGTTDARSVAPIVIATSSPAAIGIDVRLTADRLVKIAGQIVNIEQPQSSIRVDNLYLIPTASQNTADVRTLGNSAVNAAGDFEIRDVASGEHDIVATLLSNGRRYFGRTHVDVHSNEIDNIKVSLYPAADLVGRVSVRSSGPVPDLTKVLVLLQPRRNSIRGLASGSSRTDGAGNIRIQSVLPDEYRVALGAVPPGYYVESVRLDNVDVRERPVFILPTASTLEVTLAGPASSVNGKVLTEQGELPVEPTIVVLIPLQSTSEYPALSITTGLAQRGGDFNFPNVAPGPYRLLAFQALPNGLPFYDPQFLQQYLTGAKTVTIEGPTPVTVTAFKR